MVFIIARCACYLLFKFSNSRSSRNRKSLKIQWNATTRTALKTANACHEMEKPTRAKRTPSRWRLSDSSRPSSLLNNFLHDWKFFHSLTPQNGSRSQGIIIGDFSPPIVRANDLSSTMPLYFYCLTNSLPHRPNRLLTFFVSLSSSSRLFPPTLGCKLFSRYFS